jgi:hypothetical protein
MKLMVQTERTEIIFEEASVSSVAPCDEVRREK